jgi:hypothetical protein
MMLVTILGFGSNWWARYGRDPEDRHRYTRHAAYFNSAGVRCGSKIRRHWIVSGLIRFNGVGDFNPQFPRRSIGSTFECTEPAFACGGNRVLFLRRARASARPDYYLTSISSDRFGVMDFESPDWKSHSVLPIAVSRLGQKQEAVLLMKAGDSVRTDLGTWRLMAGGNNTSGASLEFTEGATLG